MREKPYYSIRTGKNPLAGSIDLPTLLRLFRPVYDLLDRAGFFQEDLGFDCVDAGFVPGTLGLDIEGALLIALRKTNLHPISERLANYSEDDLFDIIEFLYEHCSKPTERWYHDYGNCGWHCSKFNRDAGRSEYRDRVNPVLKIYNEGYDLSPSGEILSLPDAGLEALLQADVPSSEPENVQSRIEAARLKFRRYRSTLDERRDAIRDLADVLEYLRPQVKEVLASKDERDLFEIANNFGIRHHNDLQKVKYDKAIWYSWLFYYYLATIHAVLRLIAESQQSGGPSGP